MFIPTFVQIMESTLEEMKLTRKTYSQVQPAWVVLKWGYRILQKNRELFTKEVDLESWKFGMLGAIWSTAYRFIEKH